MKTIRRLVKSDDKVFAPFSKGLHEAVSARLHAVEQAMAAIAEIAGDRIRGFPKLGRDKIALNANALDGLGAAGLDAFEKVLAVLVEFFGQRSARKDQPRRDAVAADGDGLDRPRAGRFDVFQQSSAVLAELARERAAGLGQPVGDTVAANTDDLDGSRARRFDALEEVSAVLNEFARKRIARLRQLVRDRFAAPADRLDGAGRGRFNALKQVSAVLAEFARERVAGLRQAVGDGVAMKLDRVGGLDAAGIDESGDFAGMRPDRFARGLGRCGDLNDDGQRFRPQRLERSRADGAEPFGEILIARVDLGDQRLAVRLDRGVDFGHPGQQGGGALLGRARHALGDFGADLGKFFMELLALPADALDGLRSRAIHRDDDVLGRGAERRRDAVADLRKLLNDALSDALNVRGDARVRVGYRGAHVRAVDLNGFALVGHLGDQAADAALVFAGRLLERTDFRAHKRLKLGRARIGALDAVAHRRDFAADRLGKRDKLVARDRFRLGKAHRDLRDRSGGQAKLLHTARKRRIGVKENDRTQRAKREQREFRAKQRLAPGHRRSAGRGESGIAVERAKNRPGEGDHGGRDVGRAVRRLHLQRLHDGARRDPVVVGWGALRRDRRRGVGRPGRGGGAGQQGGFGRRSDWRFQGRSRRVGGRGQQGGFGLELWRRGGRRGFRLCGEVQGVLDRQHRLRYGVGGRVLLRHRVASSSCPQGGASGRGPIS